MTQRQDFKWCLTCKKDTLQTFEPADPEVGIMSAGWTCDVCEDSFIAEEEDSHD